MEQVEIIFQLDHVDMQVSDDRQYLEIVGRAVNEEVSGQLHPQPVIMVFDNDPTTVKEMFRDLNALYTDGLEIRCIGEYEVGGDADLYDYFKVKEFDIAHDYDDALNMDDALEDDTLPEIPTAADDQTMEMTP